ncbi:MAG: RNA 2',3'-cyclic phosphodiesterase [Proteobacteria bacterium]|nr:RNA 2',3'-cyclic phosphodiesterase [Pseudomonadota bacterium]
MQRLFVALSIPEPVAQAIALIQSGVPGARWQSREQLHLTLRFIGEVDGRDAAAIDDALAGISAPAFALEPHGVGEFGGKHPHALWVGVRKSEPLLHLQRKVESALQRVGIAGDRERYKPHITVARLGRTPLGKVMDWLTDHALFTAPAFEVDEFQLYSSVLTDDGSIYRPERTYRLR